MNPPLATQNHPADQSKVIVSPPHIDPVPEGVHRPLWSVMIPTFNCAKYLRQTLESVLAQDPGPDQMQIEVVDDCSTRDNPEEVVREIGKGRVAFYRKPKNEGATANFNTCIHRSRGLLVHILHGDDYVLPEFYEKISNKAKSHPEASSFFVRCQIVDDFGELDRISGRLAQLAKPSSSPDNLFYCNEIRTPGVVIRRCFYEKGGGFLPRLVHSADWEMWVRAIGLGTGVSINELLAAYREFPNNDTGRLARTAENLRDYLRLGEIFESNFADFNPGRFRAMVAISAKQQEMNFANKGDSEATSANYKLWSELTPWTWQIWTRLRQLSAR
jgi:glycosyltransferase involved in cell wall biosynthesis